MTTHTDHQPPGAPIIGRTFGMSLSRARLTITDVCADLGISRSTFYDWRAKGRGPRCIKLPNGDIRINRAEYERWLRSWKKPHDGHHLRREHLENNQIRRQEEKNL